MFGETLKNIRKRQGWSQRKLAEITGIHPQSLSRLERGERKPNFDFLVSLVRKVKIDPRDLFYESIQDDG